jgi:co-chaperonin GroES (HSP10)
MFHAHEIKGEFRPLQDWVILAPVKEDPKTRKRGGVILPEWVEDYGRCRVVAVGPGFRSYANGVYGPLFPSELKPGQFVYIQKFVEGELRFRLNGEDVYAIRERHINVTIEDISPEKRSAQKSARAESVRR